MYSLNFLCFYKTVSINVDKRSGLTYKRAKVMHDNGLPVCVVYLFYFAKLLTFKLVKWISTITCDTENTH